jgi:hypothetical protein
MEKNWTEQVIYLVFESLKYLKYKHVISNEYKGMLFWGIIQKNFDEYGNCQV